MGYTEGKHDDPADTQDRLQKMGTKYQATPPAVADGDNVYLLVDSAGRPIIGGSAAHDAADAGNPVKIGGKAVTGSVTSVADSDRVDAHFDEKGQLAVFVASDGGNNSAAIGAEGDAVSNATQALHVRAGFKWFRS